MKKAENPETLLKTTSLHPKASVDFHQSNSDLKQSVPVITSVTDSKTVLKRTPAMQKMPTVASGSFNGERDPKSNDQKASAIKRHDFQSLTTILTITFGAFAMVILALFIYHKAKQENELDEFLNENYSIMTQKYKNLAFSISEAVRSEVFYLESFVLSFLSFLNIDPNFLNLRPPVNSTQQIVTQKYNPNLVITSNGSQNSTALAEKQKLTCTDTSIETCYNALSSQTNSTSTQDANATAKTDSSIPIIASNWYHIFDKNFAIIANKDEYFSKLNMTQTTEFSRRVSSFMLNYLTSIQEEYKAFHYLGLLDSFYTSIDDKSPTAYVYFLAPSIYSNHTFFNSSALFASNSSVLIGKDGLISFVVQIDRYSDLTRKTGLRIEFNQFFGSSSISESEFHLQMFRRG